MNEPEPNRDLLAKLQLYGLQLRQQLDQSQALVASLNEEINRLAEAGLIQPLILQGMRFHSEAAQNCEFSEVGIAYQATVSVPGGFGAAIWNFDEYQERNCGVVGDSDARLRNVLFCNLPARVQAKLLPEIQPLMSSLLTSVGAVLYQPEG